MASSGSGGGGNSPFAWLGLLKWSLAYSDGTRPTGEVEPMSKEDIEFLEKVMKEGIIDEGERMKTILKELTDSLEGMLGLTASEGDSLVEEKRKELDEDEMMDHLQELRDIVEQIDYARAFMAMGGIPFLLGCATSEGVPLSIRKDALSVLSTMCQNNPPIQLSLLEHGHLPPLIQLFFDFSPIIDGIDGSVSKFADDSMRQKVVQTLSCSVRGHSMAEHIFCQNEQGKILLQMGLGMPLKLSTPSQPTPTEAPQLPKPSSQLRKRSLFLLKALVTSDDSKNGRIKTFEDAIDYVATKVINDKLEDDAELREMGLQMLTQLLVRAKSEPEGQAVFGAQIILKHKDEINALGKSRIDDIGAMKDGTEDKEYAMLELEEWKQLMVALEEAPTSAANSECEKEESAPPLMICP